MNTTKILSTISVMLQVLAVLIAFGIIAMQKTITDSFFTTVKYDEIVYPSSFAFMVISLVLYIVFFNISHNGISEGKKTLTLILLILSIIVNILGVPVNNLTNIYYSRLGVDALTMYSSVSSFISFPAVLFGGPAAALFYFACGRYAVTANHEEKDSPIQPDPYNS